VLLVSILTSEIVPTPSPLSSWREVKIFIFPEAALLGATMSSLVDFQCSNQVLTTRQCSFRYDFLLSKFLKDHRQQAFCGGTHDGFAK
jgi:hypothetical protein